MGAYLVVGAAAAAVYLLSRFLFGRKDAGWREAAARLGLTVSVSTEDGERCLSGQLEGFRVSIEQRFTGTGENQKILTRWRLDAPERIPRSLTLRRERTWDAFLKPFVGQDVLTGDARFDEAVHVQGPAHLALAFLGIRARAALLEVVAERGGMVTDGALVVERAGQFSDPLVLVETLGALAKAAHATGLPRDDAALGLAMNALEDPHPDVQLRCLQALEDHYRDSPALPATAERLLDHHATAIRLQAARIIRGDAGFKAARSILADARSEIGFRTQALDFLARTFPCDRVSPLVARALDSREDELRLAAIRCAAVACCADLVTDLAQLAERASDEEAVAIARALRDLRDARTEPLLTSLLERDSSELRVECARGLAEVGGLAAVEPLLPFTRGLVTAPVKQAAQDAVRAIQSRQASSGAGQVSVVQAVVESGAVSLAESPGAVSVVGGDDPASPADALRNRGR